MYRENTLPFPFDIRYSFFFLSISQPCPSLFRKKGEAPNFDECKTLGSERKMEIVENPLEKNILIRDLFRKRIGRHRQGSNQ